MGILQHFNFEGSLSSSLDRAENDVFRLNLKAPIMAEADEIHKYVFIVFRENKT